MAKIQNIRFNNEIYRSFFFAIVLDTRKGGDVMPVAIRVTHDYKKTYIRTGLKLTKEQFEKMQKSTVGKFFEYKKSQIEILNKVMEVAKPLIDSGTFSFESLKLKFEGVSSTTINELYRLRIAELRENGQVKTSIHYGNALSKFESYYGSDVDCSKVSPELIVDFKKRMETEMLTSSTISMYLRNLRAVCNYAIYKGVMTEAQYPFRRKSFEANKVKIPKGNKRKDSFLKVTDILRLWSYNRPENKETAKGRIVCEALNIWMFSYLANGMNLTDIARLRYDSHYFKTEGREFRFSRKKTEDTLSNPIVIYVPVIPTLKQILDEYAAPPKEGRRVFPQILLDEKDPVNEIKLIAQYGKLTNQRLKQVCKAVEISENVTMTWARHSYQTNLAHKKVPESYIDQAVGHADETVTDSYIGLYSTEDRFRYNSLLLDPDREA